MDCGKRRYPDKKAAVSAIRAVMKGGRKRPEGLRCYHCPRCRGWHLTKSKELDWKCTRAQAGARKQKFSRRNHLPARFYVEQNDS